MYFLGYFRIMSPIFMNNNSFIHLWTSCQIIFHGSYVLKLTFQGK